jgi:hypothetical protein
MIITCFTFLFLIKVTMDYITVFVHFMNLCVCVCGGVGWNPIPTNSEKLFQSSVTTNSKLTGHILFAIEFHCCQTVLLNGLRWEEAIWQITPGKCVLNFELVRYCLRGFT